MSRRLTGCVLSAWIAMLLLVQTGLTQDAPKRTTSKAASSESAPKARAKARGRLPNGWGKLGVTSEQRLKIYAVQARYQEQIDALEEQIAALKMKRDQECEACLTAKQLDQLKEATDKKTAPAADSSDK